MSTPCNMQSLIVWMVDGARDRGEGDGAQGDEVLEGAEGNVITLAFFRCAVHEDRAKDSEALCMLVIRHDKVRLGIARRYIGKGTGSASESPLQS